MEGLTAAIHGWMDPVLLRRACPRAGEAQGMEPAP